MTIIAPPQVVPVLVLILLVLILGAHAQSGLGTITGAITDPSGAVVFNAPIQAKNTQTRTVYKATTSAAGIYTLQRLSAGTYDILVPAVGFTLDKLEHKDVAIQAGQTLRLDIRVEWGPNLGTPGDDPSIFLRNKYAAKRRPAPRAPNGRPDLSGVWLGNDDPNPEEPGMLPWAADLVKERLANAFRDGPSGFCLPSGPLLTGPVLFKIVQTPALLVTLQEDAIAVRQVFMDGRGHPKDRDPSWMGHSIGHWEKDTLVVDTVGLNDRSWVGIYPHTEMLHVVERYRRPDWAHLDVEIALDDPGTFTRPWTIHNVWNLTPGEEVEEYACENNRDQQHLGRQ
jgi:carboxypeptidase family protein